MRDYGEKWTPAAPLADEAIVAGGVEVKFRTDFHLYMASGKGEADLLGDSYALPIARDRRLVVAVRPITMAEGWMEAGCAVTDMSDGFVAIEIRGEALPAVLAQATSLDWTRPQASGAISFAGVNAYGSLIEEGAVVRIFVETAFAPYLRLWLEAVAEDLAAQSTGRRELF